MSDTKKFRAAFKAAGFLQRNPWLPTVFNDKRKKSGIRRIKLWNADHVFSAPEFAQQRLDAEFQRVFGSRYLFGEFIAQHPRIADKALVIYLID
jgi:hypothetical protein